MDKYIESQVKKAPETAIIIDRYDKEREVPTEDIKVGDIFVVRPGATIPVDGFVIEGNSTVDESPVTGEHTPVDKRIGSGVIGASINTSGYLKCKASRVGSETTLRKIVDLLSEFLLTRAPIQEHVLKVSQILTALAIAIAIISFAIWFYLGHSISFCITKAVCVLIVSIPCLIILNYSTGTVLRSAGITGANNGILFKDAKSLENLGKTQILVLNKTGTVTKGEPVVLDVFTPDSITRSGYSLINNSENELLKIAGLLERKGNHPLAKAVVDYVGDVNNYIEDLDEEDVDITDYEVLPGHGMKGKYRGHEVVGASLKYVSSIVHFLPEVREKAVALANQGKTPLCFTKDNKLLGIIAIADGVKEESAKAIGQMKAMGVHVVMLTGDNVRTAMALSDQAGVDEVASEILPSERETIVKKLRQIGKVTMAGNAVKDMELLNAADMGVSIGAGLELSREIENVVLLKNSLNDLAGAIRLSRATLGNIRQNLSWCTIYTIVFSLLAGGILIKPFGFDFNIVFSFVAACLSCFIQFLNTKGQRQFDIFDASKDKQLENALTGELLRKI